MHRHGQKRANLSTLCQSQVHVSGQGYHSIYSSTLHPSRSLKAAHAQPGSPPVHADADSTKQMLAACGSQAGVQT